MYVGIDESSFVCLRFIMCSFIVCCLESFVSHSSPVNSLYYISLET